MSLQPVQPNIHRSFYFFPDWIWLSELDSSQIHTQRILLCQIKFCLWLRILPFYNRGWESLFITKVSLSSVLSLNRKVFLSLSDFIFDTRLLENMKKWIIFSSIGIFYWSVHYSCLIYSFIFNVHTIRWKHKDHWLSEVALLQQHCVIEQRCTFELCDINSDRYLQTGFCVVYCTTDWTDL